LDIDELIENKQNTHEKLHELSMALRARSFGSEPAGAGFLSLGPTFSKEHSELMVDAGSKAVFQANHLAGENDNMRLVSMNSEMKRPAHVFTSKDCRSEHCKLTCLLRVACRLKQLVSKALYYY